jgi:predicted lipase
VELAQRYNGSQFSTTMVNFGMPRVGDPSFAQLFARTVTSSHVRASSFDGVCACVCVCVCVCLCVCVCG